MAPKNHLRRAQNRPTPSNGQSLMYYRYLNIGCANGVEPASSRSNPASREISLASGASARWTAVSGIEPAHHRFICLHLELKMNRVFGAYWFVVAMRWGVAPRWYETRLWLDPMLGQK
jgi:hypothetical protein